MVKTIMKLRKDRFLITYLFRNPLQLFGIIYFFIAIILALIGPIIIPNSPTTPNPTARLLPPSSKYWFGTDVNGMCVFSRTIYAFRTDLIISLTGALLAMFIGAPIGVFAGFFDGRKGISGFFSSLILRIMDVIQAFPIFVLGLLLVAGLGPSYLNIILLICITNLPSNLRLARSEVLIIREKTYIDAARTAGNKATRIIFSHAMPNALTPVLALISVVMGFGILLTAGLSFVGAGIRVPTPEWGSMISIGAPAILTGEWWAAFFPGAVMAITIFSFSMTGEAITALMDPLERVKLGFSQ
jgi:peptide/nickel transport system permease protein